MLYLIDASVLITAQNTYYPLDSVPEYWGWLCHVCTEGHTKVPLETYDEIKDGGDDLAAWIKEDGNKAALLLDEQADQAVVTRVISEGYAPDLDDVEMEQLGRDPFLIAYAITDPAQRCVVTTEVSKPTRQRANRHIPDVCDSLGVRCVDAFQFARALTFKTNWAL